MKTLLLASAAALALTAGGASARHAVPPVTMKATTHGKAFRVTPRAGSTASYGQSAGSASNSIASTELENSSYAGYDSRGADDFVIPGSGKHTITAVYANGINYYGYGYGATSMNVIFYTKLKYSAKRGLTANVKAVCTDVPSFDLSGSGFLEADVSGCAAGKFKGGHDYSVSVQTRSNYYFQNWWYWTTNANKVGKEALWSNYGGAFYTCPGSYKPVQTCFPSGYAGPDFAFGVIGN